MNSVAVGPLASQRPASEDIGLLQRNAVPIPVTDGPINCRTSACWHAPVYIYCCRSRFISPFALDRYRNISSRFFCFVTTHTFDGEHFDRQDDILNALLLNNIRSLTVCWLQLLIHRCTRTDYLYNGCLAWYNVLITSRVHPSVKSQFPKVRQTKYTAAD